MATKADKDKQRLITPEFRVSYPHLFKPSGMKGSTPKYSVTMLFPKNADLSELKAAMHAAKVAMWGSDKSNWKTCESPVVDGDKPKFADKAGYKGHWAIKASTSEDQRPGVIARDGKTPITNAADVYPGCYGRAYIYAYVWEFGSKFGVGLILDHVQKLRDGDAFGGKKPAEQVFTPFDDGEEEEDFSEDDIDF